MFSPELLEHFANPRNVGVLPAPAIRVEVSNAACGDELVLYVRFEGERVAGARYQTRGCTATIAAGSALTEWLLNRSAQELGGLAAAAIEDALGGLPAASHHAAVLCADAVKAVLRAR